MCELHTLRAAGGSRRVDNGGESVCGDGFALDQRGSFTHGIGGFIECGEPVLVHKHRGQKGVGTDRLDEFGVGGVVREREPNVRVL